MGLIISRFRKSQTTIEVLEGIEKDITKLQKNRRDNQDKQKRIATSLLIYSFILYVLSAVVFFFLYFPDTWPLRLLYSLPLLAFPFLIWGMKKILHWYFVKRIHANDLALRDLREKKKQILEDVMETETYKRAKEILEKFDPARFKRLENDEANLSSGGTSPTSLAPGLHQRKPVLQPSTPKAAQTPSQRPPALSRLDVGHTTNPYTNTPLRAPTPAGRAPLSAVGSTTGPSRQQHQNLQQPRPQMAGSQPNTPAQMGRGVPMGRGFALPPGPPMPRSVLPRERGTMDRFMDYLVGDGPENRFALVCNVCFSHNGMALKEEFEYMSFRCCYCYNFNPARKQRPMAPRLEFFTPRPSNLKPSSEESDSDDEDDEEEDEDEKKDNDNSNQSTVSGKTSAVTISSSQKHHPGAPSSSSRGQSGAANVGTPRKSEGQSQAALSMQPVKGSFNHSKANTTSHNPQQSSNRQQTELARQTVSSNGGATMGQAKLSAVAADVHKGHETENVKKAGSGEPDESLESKKLLGEDRGNDPKMAVSEELGEDVSVDGNRES